MIKYLCMWSQKPPETVVIFRGSMRTSALGLQCERLCYHSDHQWILFYGYLKINTKTVSMTMHKTSIHFSKS